MLPREAELRNWAARGLEAKGEVLLDSMSRLKAVVTRAAVPATARIKCRKDEQYRYVVEVEAEMTVTLQCQRCLGDCEKELATTSTLCVLWGFNAVRAFVTAQQGVVIFVAAAFIFKGLGFKKLKIMGEILTDGDSKLCHITGGRFLF